MRAEPVPGAKRKSRPWLRWRAMPRSCSRTPSSTSGWRSSASGATRSSRTLPMGSSPSIATARSCSGTRRPSRSPAFPPPPRSAGRRSKCCSASSRRRTAARSASGSYRCSGAGKRSGCRSPRRSCAIPSERIVEQMKSDFVSTVSHELRAPLTSIYGFAETLLRRDVLLGEQERETFLGYIASEAQRLTSIVDTLLSVARLEAGDLQVELVPTDLRTVVSEAVTSMRQTAELNGHRFVVELPDEPLSASADREKLSQILANLLDNAVKFSPGGGTVTVE